MFSVISCNGIKEIENCNFNLLSNAVQHPNRILENTHDLLYILDGYWEIVQDDEVYELKRDDVLLLHAGHHHYGKTLCMPNTDCMFIHFKKTAGDFTVTSDAGCTQWDDALFIRSVTHCGNNSTVKKLFKKIIYSYYSGQPHITIKLSALMTELLYELSAASDSSLYENSGDELINSILHKVHVSSGRIYSVEELAEEYFISPSTLASRFKSATGFTLHSYQLNSKLIMAHNLISTDDSVRIKDVALLFGFCDEFHFSKTFKKKFGVSPAEIRRSFSGTSSQPDEGERKYFSTCW